MIHFRPFHRSAKGTGAPELFRKDAPTAVQADGDVHDRPFRKLNCVPEGFGVGWMLHLVPFHRSAKAPEFEAPTEVQAEDVVQDT